MKTELTRTCGMFPAERIENEIDACSRDGAANGFLPAGVAQVPKDELQRFLKCKRVGNYLIGKTIGEGSFARVKQGFHVLAGEKVAVKIIDKKKAHQDKYVSRNMRREAKIMQMVRHPHIVQLLEVVETKHRYYLMTELAAGGDLMDYICYRRKLGEVEVRKFIRQIVSAVYYLHQGGILHRDLKVENLLLDEDYNIKIIDFGLSNTLHVRPSEGQSRAEHLKTQCGSPAYAAPEILGHKPYGPGVDVWSIGVNMFAMLTGKLPYTAEPFNITTLYNKMRRNEMNPIPSHLSSSCQDLIQRFLTFHPEKRITLEQALTHEWLQKGFSEPVIPIQFPNYPREEDLNDSVTQHMVNKMEFNEQEVVDAVTQNRATPVSTVYHLLGRRLMKYSLKHPDKMNKHIKEARLRASTPDEKLTSTTESVSRSRATGRKTKHMNFSEETEQTVDSVDACESNGEDNEEKDSDKLNVPARRARLSSPSREDLSAANSQNFGVMGDVQDSAGIANVENETNGNQSDDQKDRSCSISSDAGLEISRKTSCDCSSVGMMAINGRKLSLNLSHISVESKSTTVKETLRNTSLTISSLKNFANHRVQETVEKISSIPVDALKQEQTGRKGTNEKTPPKQRPKAPCIGKVSPISAKIISIPLKQVKQDPCDKAKSHSRRFSFPHSGLPASRLSRTLGTSHQAALGPFSFNSSLRPTSTNERQTQQVSPSLPPYGLCCQLTAVKNRDVESAELHACACDAKSRDNRNQRPLYHRHSVAVTGGKELLKSINNTLGKLVELSENEPSKTKDGLLMRSRLPRSILNASSQHEAAVEGVKTTLLPEHRGLKRAKEKRAAGLRISCSVKDSTSHSRTSSSLPSPMGTSSPDSKQLMNVEKEIMQERGARRRRRKTEDNNVFASNRDRAVSPNTQQ